jgi:Coenzyme PQQ synthesis protein D (PqqD)
MPSTIRLEMDKPKARTKDLLIEEIGGEVLVYDLTTNRAHCLNPSAASVWKHCDGSRTVPELAGHLFPEVPGSSGEQIVNIALERLGRRRLLEGEIQAPTPDLSRRQLLRRVAVTVAVLGIAAPLVSTVIAPTSAYAFSGCFPAGMPCTSFSQCCSMICNVTCGG